MNDTQTMRYITANEGEVLKPYPDSKGYWTIGIGHRIFGEVPAKWKEGIGTQEMFNLFFQDYKTAVIAAEHVFPDLYDYPEDAQMVLVDMCFQMGQGNDTLKTGVEGFDNMQKAIDNGDWNEAAWCLLDSKYAKEDTPKRAIQNALILKRLA